MTLFWEFKRDARRFISQRMSVYTFSTTCNEHALLATFHDCAKFKMAMFTEWR